MHHYIFYFIFSERLQPQILSKIIKVDQEKKSICLPMSIIENFTAFLK